MIPTSEICSNRRQVKKNLKTVGVCVALWKKTWLGCARIGGEKPNTRNQNFVSELSRLMSKAALLLTAHGERAVLRTAHALAEQGGRAAPSTGPAKPAELCFSIHSLFFMPRTFLFITDSLVMPTSSLPG